MKVFLPSLLEVPINTGTTNMLSALLIALSLPISPENVAPEASPVSGQLAPPLSSVMSFVRPACSKSAVCPPLQAGQARSYSDSQNGE